MKAVKFTADFDPKPGLQLSEKEKLDKRGRVNSDKIFRHPKVELVDVPQPKIQNPDDVLIRLKDYAEASYD